MTFRPYVIDPSNAANDLQLSKGFSTAGSVNSHRPDPPPLDRLPTVLRVLYRSPLLTDLSVVS